MTSKPESSFNLFSLSWPLFIQLLLTYSILITDSYFLSIDSLNAAASIGALLPVYCIFYMTFNALSQAGSSVSSQYHGAKRYDLANTSLASTIISLILFGALSSLILYAMHSKIGTILGMNDVSNDIVSIYIMITGSSMVLEALRVAYNGVLTALGKTKLVMMASIAMVAINLISNLICLNYGMGVYGVAYSTVLSQIGSIVILMVLTHKIVNLKFKPLNIKNNIKSVSFHIFRIGIPASIEPVSVQFLHIVLTMMIISFGVESLAIKTYAYNILTPVIALSVAVGVGNMILVARHVGAKDFDNADRQVNRSLLYCILLVLFITLPIYLLSDSIFIHFTDNDVVLDGIRTILLISIFFEVSRCFNVIFQLSLSSTGDATYSAFSGAIIMWCIGVPCCYFFGVYLGYGLLGVFLASLGDEALRSLVYYLRWKSRKWEQKGVLA